MATVNKNFRIKQGLVVEGTTGTINGQNILTETGSDTYILNLIGGGTLVKSVSNQFDVSAGGELSLDRTVVDAYYDPAGSAAAAQAAAEDYADGLAGNYDAAGSATSAAAQALSDAQDYADAQIDDTLTSTTKTWSSYKTNAEIGSAQTAAQDYADGLINDASNASDEVWSAYKTSTEIGLAQAAAEQHVDEAVAALVGSAPELLDTIQELATALENNPDIIADLENVAAGKQNTLTAGANIDITADTISVTGLDTDDVTEGTNLYFTNQRAIDAVGGSATSENTPDTVVKRDQNGNFAASDITVDEISIGSIGRIYDDGGTLVIENIDGDDVTVNADDIRFYAQDDIRLNSALSGDVVLTVDTGNIRLEGSNIYAGTNLQYVDSERVATQGYVDDAQTDAESTAQAALDNVLNGTTPFTEINVNDQAKQIAATASINTGSASTVYQWAKADYRSAKLLVKIDNGTHNEISEILVTLDSSDNVAITEYAIVGTNGSRGTITAVVSGSNVLVTVNPTNNSTVKVTGTLLK